MISKIIYKCDKCGAIREDRYPFHFNAKIIGNYMLIECKGKFVPVIWFQADEVRKAIEKWITCDCNLTPNGKTERDNLLKELGL